MAHKKNQTDFKIQGLIVPVSWDEEGNPLSVAVSTFDEKEYIVQKDIKGNQLFGLLREQVEVRGEVRIRDGVKTIKVKKFVLIKKPELIDGTSHFKP
ncbi:MAG: hypothetical protein JW896_16725 [Deltaproteobacteria bacterium]|nr:hypothetical protein [Deltaproteobacteria bacterium]